MSASAVCALVYGAWYSQRDPSAVRSLLKTASVALLAVAAAVNGGPVLLVLALAFSALGDLALSRDGERAFLTGLGSFALAHLLFILLLAGFAAGWPPLLPVLALVGFAASTELWLAPHTGAMRWPVRVYVLLIAGMGIAALALPATYALVLVGAGLFMASDSFLALQLFRMNPDSRWQDAVSRGLWALYYVAQVLILQGILG